MRTKVSAGRSSLPWISGLSRFSSHGCYGSLQMRSWPFYSALRSKLLSLISVQAWNESLTAVGFVIWNHCGCKGIKSTLQTVPSLSSHPSEKLNPKKNLFRAVCFPGSFFLGKDKKKKSSSRLYCHFNTVMWQRILVKNGFEDPSLNINFHLVATCLWKCHLSFEAQFPQCKMSCSSVVKSCPILFGPTDCSTSGSLSSTTSQSLLKLMSIESMMLSKHLFYCPLLLMPSFFPSIRVFSSVSALCIR